jgi:purine-binding chemotaxis protein CheW
MGTAQARRYCTFYLGEECFALDILAVREINRRVAVTPVRGAVPAVRGLLNLRGQITTVIDPAVRLGGPPRELGASTRLIVLKTNAELGERRGEGLETCDELVGLCVDRISDVIAIADETVEPVPAGEESAADPLIRGVAHHGDECVRILEPRRLIALRGAP